MSNNNTRFSQNLNNQRTTTQNKNQFVTQGKTRIESLDDRINIAIETIKNIYDVTQLEKISKKKTEKTVTIDLEKIANTIVSKNGPENLKTIKVPGENSETENLLSQIEIDSPFIKRMQFIINEITNLKTNSNINEEELNKEVSSLPNRSLIELALSKTKLNKKQEKLLKNNENKNSYIKRLENEVVNQRLSLENLKKSEGENLLKISTLEDQIRILKSKVFGYDISKKYEYYKEHEQKSGPSAQIQDENLAYSMWEKENYAEKKNPTKLNKLENEKQMWIGNSQNNIDKLVHDVNVANSYKAGKGYMVSDEDNGLWTKTPEQAKNRNGNERGLAGNNNISSNYNRYDRKGNNNNGNLGNMRRITPMIMNKNSKY